MLLHLCTAAGKSLVMVSVLLSVISTGAVVSSFTVSQPDHCIAQQCLIELSSVDSTSLPVERRKLQLQPRSKPTEPEQTQGSSSIFGGAKPVDTLSRELAVEERLRQKDEEERKRLEEERAKREEEERVRRVEEERHAEERTELVTRREKERHPSRSDEGDWRRSDEGTGSRR